MSSAYDRQVVDILSEILGLPKSSKPHNSEYEFNCPVCDTGRNKYNLGINTSKSVFHCWSCKIRGKLKTLIRTHGTPRQLKMFARVARGAPAGIKSVAVYDNKDKPKVTLGDHRSLLVEWKDSLHYLAAKNYLRDRGITDSIIKKWDMCYSESGKNKFRIIVPSRLENGKLEYYVARSFYDYVKPKYLNPPIKKSDLIFGEDKIDWKETVVIVEGVFDSIVYPNAVPILGSEIDGQLKLIKKILDNKTPVIVCLDAEAWSNTRAVYTKFKNLGVDVKAAKVPDEYGDLSVLYREKGPNGVLEVLNSAKHLSLLEEII